MKLRVEQGTGFHQASGRQPTYPEKTGEKNMKRWRKSPTRTPILDLMQSKIATLHTEIFIANVLSSPYHYLLDLIFQKSWIHFLHANSINHLLDFHCKCSPLMYNNPKITEGHRVCRKIYNDRCERGKRGKCGYISTDKEISDILINISTVITLPSFKWNNMYHKSLILSSLPLNLLPIWTINEDLFNHNSRASYFRIYESFRI